MQRQLCVARSARPAARCRGGATGRRIIIICKQASERVRARGASRDRAPLAAAAAASRRARQSAAERRRVHMHADRPRATRHAHNWRDRELRFPFCLFFACVLRTVLFPRQRDEEKKEARMDRAREGTEFASYTKVLWQNVQVCPSSGIEAFGFCGLFS